MIETKLIELRDSATFIPMLAARMVSDNEDELYLLRRAGYGMDYPLVLLTKLDGGESRYDSYDWPGGVRTFSIAHEWIQNHWSEITSGDVVDVEFITGMRSEPKVSERIEFPIYE